MVSQDWSEALTTSTHAIVFGVVFAVGDATVQYVVSGAELTFKVAQRKLCHEEEAEGEPAMRWELARTFTAFVGGATLGTALSLVTMTFVKRLGLPHILANIVPTELLLLPFQTVCLTGNAWHFARNLPGYMMLLTLLDLMVGWPVLFWSFFEPNTASGLPQLAAAEVRAILLGMSSVGFFMFANRYPEKQWTMEVDTSAGEWVSTAHPLLIVAGQVMGNLCWVLLFLFSVTSGSSDFPLWLTIPPNCYQLIVNVHMQLVSVGDVPVGTRMLRVFIPILTIPADHMTDLAGLQQAFNMLAFSSYTLWVSSFQDEWKRLYDELEGSLDRPDSFILNDFLEPTNYHQPLKSITAPASVVQSEQPSQSERAKAAEGPSSPASRDAGQSPTPLVDTTNEH
eukprot:EG_transcript_11741